MPLQISPDYIPIQNNKANKELRSLYFLQEYNKSKVEIYLKDIIPDTLSYSYSPGFSSQNLLGRMSPIQIYTGGSARTYSFNVMLHEDYLEKTGYTRLDDLVDDIKSLSYPKTNSAGIVSLPRVFFQIGEISGYGLVQTSINWTKPFRNGRYIVVDLGFTITVEEIIPAVTVTVTTTGDAVNDVQVKYTSGAIVRPLSDTMFIESAYDKYNSFNNYYNAKAYDFTVASANDEMVASNIANLVAYTEDRYTRLSNIIGILDKGDVLNSEEFKNAQPDLDFLKNKTYSIVAESSSEYRTFIDDIEALKNDFEEYLTYYYDNVDKNMTRESYNAILADIYSIIDGIAGMYEAVMEYGAGR